MPLARVWKALRIINPKISLPEIKSSVQQKRNLNLCSFDATRVDVFVRQLHALTEFYEQIQSSQFPIELIESQTRASIDKSVLAKSLRFHENTLFKTTPPVIALLEKLKKANWVGNGNGIAVGDYGDTCDIVREIPSTFDSLSEIMFVISSHFRQKLDDLGCHPDTLASCFREVGDASDGIVSGKFSGTYLANRSDFLALIASVIKLACGQLFVSVRASASCR